MYGIKYNNKYSWDLGLKVLERNISTPAKKKVTEEIPFSNVIYDFSFLYGSQIFEPRKLEYKFFVDEMFKHNLESARIVVENWLYSSNEKTELRDKVTPGYHFLAECIDIDFEDLKTYGTIKATFEGYPFRIKNEYEGEMLWDDFCFLTDILQQTTFIINEAREISLINNSIVEVVPKIIADNSFEIYRNNVKYLIPMGTTESTDFKLNTGVNKLTIIGNGNIQFKYKIEVI